MSLQTYNTIELRYADTELAKNQFVKLADVEEEIVSLQETNEILRAERSHWHHMYNQEADNGEDS